MRALRGVGCSLVVLVAALVGGELVLRVLLEDAWPPVPAERAARHADVQERFDNGLLRPATAPLVYELVPGASATAWNTEVVINSAGLRDEEIALRKPAGVQRVVALGDSVTFGIQLAVEDTWPEQLEELAAQAGRTVEVVNAGVVGYDVSELVEQLQRRGLRFSPDLVVLALHLNDAGYASITRDYLLRTQPDGGVLGRSRIVQMLRRLVDVRALERTLEDMNSDASFARLNEGRIADVSGDHELNELQRALRASLDADGPLRAALDASPVGRRYLAWYTTPSRVGRIVRAAGAARTGARLPGARVSGPLARRPRRGGRLRPGLRDRRARDRMGRPGLAPDGRGDTKARPRAAVHPTRRPGAPEYEGARDLRASRS